MTVFFLLLLHSPVTVQEMTVVAATWNSDSGCDNETVTVAVTMKFYLFFFNETVTVAAVTGWQWLWQWNSTSSSSMKQWQCSDSGFIDRFYFFSGCSDRFYFFFLAAVTGFTSSQCRHKFYFFFFLVLLLQWLQWQVFSVQVLLSVSVGSDRGFTSSSWLQYRLYFFSV